MYIIVHIYIYMYIYMPTKLTKMVWNTQKCMDWENTSKMSKLRGCDTPLHPRNFTWNPSFSFWTWSFPWCSLSKGDIFRFHINFTSALHIQHGMLCSPHPHRHCSRRTSVHSMSNMSVGIATVTSIFVCFFPHNPARKTSQNSYFDLLFE